MMSHQETGEKRMRVIREVVKLPCTISPFIWRHIGSLFSPLFPSPVEAMDIMNPNPDGWRTFDSQNVEQIHLKMA
jgi:hypothetical protein